ncbi:hypothetical protein EV385_3936 [Krasilnikovia cinnamomea]|uniref:Uncharacterized protein n=1 Tax=Krasilnikovia cinnamomea TaxID=349313 RepID=A0A4Q7ZNX3_9ACTN|nr:hypothetical protein EV385_3936 [Krasilnikovia cinnamomea]
MFSALLLEEEHDAHLAAADLVYTVSKTVTFSPGVTFTPTNQTVTFRALARTNDPRALSARGSLFSGPEDGAYDAMVVSLPQPPRPSPPRFRKTRTEPSSLAMR